MAEDDRFPIFSGTYRGSRFPGFVGGRIDPETGNLVRPGRQRVFNPVRGTDAQEDPYRPTAARSPVSGLASATVPPEFFGGPSEGDNLDMPEGQVDPTLAGLGILGGAVQVGTNLALNASPASMVGTLGKELGIMDDVTSALGFGKGASTDTANPAQGETMDSITGSGLEAGFGGGSGPGSSMSVEQDFGVTGEGSMSGFGGFDPSGFGEPDISADLGGFGLDGGGGSGVGEPDVGADLGGIFRHGGQIPSDGDGRLEAVPVMAHESEFVLSPEATAYWGPDLIGAMQRIGAGQGTPRDQQMVVAMVMQRASGVPAARPQRGGLHSAWVG